MALPLSEQELKKAIGSEDLNHLLAATAKLTAFQPNNESDREQRKLWLDNLRAARQDVSYEAPTPQTPAPAAPIPPGQLATPFPMMADPVAVQQPPVVPTPAPVTQLVIPVSAPPPPSPATPPALMMAQGGSVPDHPGKPQGTDTVPAWLTPGEVVVPRDIAAINRPQLEDMGVQHLAKGGRAGFEIGGSSIKTIAGAMAGDPSKILDVVLNKLNRIMEGFEKIPAGIGEAATSQRAGGVMAGVGHSLEGAGQATDIPGLGSLGKFIAAVGEGAEKLQDFARKLHEGNIQFAEFSGAMSQVRADQFQRDVDLQEQRGERRAGSAETLAQGMHKLNVQFARLDDRWANLQNNVFGKVADTIADKLQLILDKVLGEEKDLKGEGETLTEVLMAADRGLLDSGNGNPGAFGRPPHFGAP